MSEYFLDKIKEYGFLVITLLPLTLTMSLEILKTTLEILKTTACACGFYVLNLF